MAGEGARQQGYGDQRHGGVQCRIVGGQPHGLGVPLAEPQHEVLRLVGRCSAGGPQQLQQHLLRLHVPALYVLHDPP